MIKNRPEINTAFRKRRTGLSDLLKLYEINYLKLKKLIPSIHSDEEKVFYLPEGTKSSQVTINVTKESKFTSRLIISQNNSSIAAMESHIMEIAIYHDLKMIEVVRFNGKHQFWSRNSFPNKNMLSKDEKFQWNKYLSELLDFSKNEGLANIIFKIS